MRQRLRSALSTAVLLALVAGLGWIVVIMARAATAGTSTTAANRGLDDCRSRYARARTVADTLRTDAHYPPLGTAVGYGGRGSQAVSCGYLRKNGDLGLAQQVPPRAYVRESAGTR